MKTKVAIVEDEASIRQLYHMKLELEGFEVQTAENGIRGLEMLEAFQPEILLLDIRMPEMNGDEMLARVRDTDWGEKMHVIILTNLSKDEAPSILRFLDVDRYIVKAHYTPTQVVQVVHEVLNH